MPLYPFHNKLVKNGYKNDESAAKANNLSARTCRAFFKKETIPCSSTNEMAKFIN
jgi:hypothetical protein